MKLGVTVRNMGPESTRELLLYCARKAEAAGLDHIWALDHIAIPPEDSEGSDGRYLDPLAALAFLAAATERIGLGTSVLVLPYRPMLPTAKWVATIQELSGGRFHLGVGVGWMEPEFRALGVPRNRRGAISDEILQGLHACFDAPDDQIEMNGQKFLFRPRPAKPPIYVGGMGRAAKRRAVTLGDGWLPMGLSPEKMALEAKDLAALAAEAGRPTPEIVLGAGLPEDPIEALDFLRAHREIGVTQFIDISRYRDQESFDRKVARIADLGANLSA